MSSNADDPTDIEEERRLCCIGITRAMKRLYLSAARQRMVRGETQFNRPSRFINEIPRYLLVQSSASSSRYSSGSQFGGSQSKTPYYGSGSSQKGGTWTPPTYMEPETTSGGMRNFSGAITSTKSTNSTSDKNNVFANNPFISKGFSGACKLGSTTFDKVKPTATVIDYSVGDTVKHIKFGVGIVAEMVKQTDDYMVTVDFDTFGVKKMKASFAKLIKL